MATYKVLEKSFINNALQEEGAIIEYDGEPSENLELVSKAKPKAKPQAKDGVDDAE